MIKLSFQSETNYDDVLYYIEQTTIALKWRSKKVKLKSRQINCIMGVNSGIPRALPEKEMPGRGVGVDALIFTRPHPPMIFFSIFKF